MSYPPPSLLKTNFLRRVSRCLNKQKAIPPLSPRSLGRLPSPFAPHPAPPRRTPPIFHPTAPPSIAIAGQRFPQIPTRNRHMATASATTRIGGIPPAPSIESLNEQLNNFGISEPLALFPDSNPTANPVDVYRCYISHVLAPITGVDIGLVYPALEWTQNLEKGDLILAVPRLRIPGKNPAELAREWAEKFPKNPYVRPPTATGTFLRFYFKKDVLSKLVLTSILSRKSAYGPIDTGKGKRVVVEFSSPNIAKPFHAGHLRSTIIGGFLSNLYESCGWDVVRMNYLGDWGKQFGILGVGYKRFGSEEKLLEDPVNHLFEVYVAINKIVEQEKEAEKAKAAEKGQKQISNGPSDQEAHEFFFKMENGSEECIAMWKRFRELSIEKYKATYSRLNISYDDYSGESQVSKESMERAGKMMREMGISSESDGAIVVDFKPHAKKLGKAVVQKKDGTTLYLTRDIGAAMERYEKYKFDKMIYVVACQQDLHLQQLFMILKLLKLDWADRLSHVNFGMVLGMSSRRGTVVFLDDILADARDKMHEVMRKNEEKYKQVEDPEMVADVIGRTAVMIQDMSGKRINNYTFDMARMTSFEGDTGPYLQYAHSRLSSIQRKAGIPTEELLKADFSLLTEDHATNLVRCLAQYPDVLQNTLKTLEPTTVVTYLFKMTHLLSSSYDVLRVLGEEPKLSAARMALYESARQVLNNGMRLLGLTPVDRM
ncbi:arginyl-tRNA synthetase [Tuber magnatum]|uniref:arginine--tRNA ligase n=1 Tax=Tuber magnatum TaxID=42249 RepID=A0A317SDM5_9PEZI|nr:arginyl-tRNA synthetase [Tuber magnatum]